MAPGQGSAVSAAPLDGLDSSPLVTQKLKEIGHTTELSLLSTAHFLGLQLFDDGPVGV